MVQNYTVWVENNAYPVVVSDEREALLAAKAVGRVFVALYTEIRNRKLSGTPGISLPRMPFAQNT